MCNIKLKESSPAIHHFVQKLADALEITVLNTKTSSASGGFNTLAHTGGSVPGPQLGATPQPQTQIIRSRCRARHGCVY